MVNFPSTLSEAVHVFIEEAVSERGEIIEAACGLAKV
jgi:hypothetical protein